MKNKILIQNLDLYYKNVQALHNISMEIAAQKTTAIIGPAGSGKTTILRAINRMHHPRQGIRLNGRVLLDGANVYGAGYDTTQLRKKVGMIFPKPQLFPTTIYDNIAFGPRVHGIKSHHRLNEIVEQSLRAVLLWPQLRDSLKKPNPVLTPGQLQRLCIARVLAVNPEVLLLDEPTLLLDAIDAGQVEQLVVTLEQQYTIVLATQNISQAARLSHNTAFLQSGALVEFGNTSDVFVRPTDQRTEDYLTRRFN